MKIDKEKFWKKVKRGVFNACWPWSGCIHKARGGYGLFSISGKWTGAHRVAWMCHTNRAIPDGMVILHKCDNPSCCNPRHLDLGTHADNHADMFSKNRHAKGERVAGAKLTEKDVVAIFSDSRPNIRIAPDYGISRITVGHIKNGHTWRHITDNLR